MLLTRLQLRNLGPFGGTHNVELRPLTRQRPIVLFGGKNGAGKTTILEAVRLALYGRRALGNRSTAVDYQAYLSSRIHRAPTDSASPSSASVAVEFEHGQLSERSTYRVERGWALRGNRVTEDLLVLRDGHPLDRLDRDHWQSFIDNLIPAALAQLFFFDGERIQALADDDAGDNELASAIRTLLGLDLVEQLQADLAIYQSRQRPAGESKLQDRLATIVAEREVIRDEAARIRQELAAVQARVDRQYALIRKHEDRLTQEGGAFAQRRSLLRAEQSQLTAERGLIEEEIRALSAGLLPFALAPKLSLRIVDVLEREARREVDLLRTSVIEELRADVEQALSGTEFWIAAGIRDATPDVQEPLVRQIRALFPALQTDDRPDQPPLHGLSATARSRVVAQLERALVETAPAARVLGERLERVSRAQQRINDHLRQAPADEELQPLVEALSRDHEALGALNQEKHRLLQREHQLQIQHEHLDREFNRLQDELRQNDTVARRIQLGARAQAALRDFHGQLSTARITELEETLAYCFNRLVRKEDLVARVAIDPVTFRVTLLDGDGRSLPRAQLSAGEKQIFAISLLWALAQVSGRKLPMIIDTPLGRLDSDHRQNLTSKYFPFAAEQVIILSTDSEIDQTLMRLLLPAVSRSYHLDYIPENRSSRIASGYFWDAGTPVVSHQPEFAQELRENEDGIHDWNDDDYRVSEPRKPLESATPLT